jgi:hypothetical protein
MVLVIVDRLVDHTADDLLNDDVTHMDEFLDVLTVHGSIGARKKPSTGRYMHP